MLRVTYARLTHNCFVSDLTFYCCFLDFFVCSHKNMSFYLMADSMNIGRSILHAMTALLVTEAGSTADSVCLSVHLNWTDGRTACLQFFCRRAITAAYCFDQPVRAKDDIITISGTQLFSILTWYSNAVGVVHDCCLSSSVVLCNGCIVAKLCKIGPRLLHGKSQ